MSSEETLTVTIPAALAREYCARIHHENTPHARLKEVLLAQLPREIEEGCRVTTMSRLWRGTCGKPFKGQVLVKWDHVSDSVVQWPLASLVRID